MPGRVEEVGAVDVEDVEEVGGDRHSRRLRSARRRLLERARATVFVERERLAVEDEPGGGQRADDLDDLGKPRGDVVEAAGRDQHVVAVTVHLDPDAVELGVDRDPPAARLGHRSLDVGCARGQHRLHRPADLQAERVESLGAFGEGGDRHGGGGPGEHGCPADLREREPGGRGDGLLHQRVERALPDGAGDDAPQPRLLVGGGPPEQVGDGGCPGGLGPGAGDLRDRVERMMDLQHRQAGGVGRLRQCAQTAPAKPGPTLSEAAGEIRGGGLDLVGLGPGERGGECGHLGLAGAGRGHGQ